MPIEFDLTGHKFYSLEVLEPIPNKRINGSLAWLCRCDCGKIIETNTKQLTSHRKKSCGCTRYKTKQPKEYEDKPEIYQKASIRSSILEEVLRTNEEVLRTNYEILKILKGEND